MKSKTHQNHLVSSNKDNLSILIIDDEKLVSQVLTRALESEPDLEIVGTVDNAHSAVENISILSPDIVLMDIEMPEIDGLTLTSMITEEFPNIKVIIYSGHYEQEYIRKALMSGAKGYLIKDHAVEEVAYAIRFVNKGFFHLGKGLLEKISSNPQSLGKDNGLTRVSEKRCGKGESSVEDWSPSTKDLLDTLPRVLTRELAYMLIVLAGILIPWGSMSRVEEFRNCPREFNFEKPSKSCLIYKGGHCPPYQ